MSAPRNQNGSTLLVALIMLVLLTLIALSAMSTSTTSIQVVGNAQVREEAIAAGQRAIENVISSGDFRNATPATQTIDINLDDTADYTVVFDAPNCVSYRQPTAAEKALLPPACTGSAEIGVTCYWTVWDIKATVTDNVTGARAEIHQGIKTIAGLNAAVAYCGL